MPVLHLVNHTPHGNESLARCLASLGEDDGLLLIEDAVYAALNGVLSPEDLQVLVAANSQCFVLEPHLAARGLSGRRLTDGFQCVDFADFVDLVASYDTSISWG